MIAHNFDSAFERVKLLVLQFEQNQKQYLSPSYSEAQARLDFIDKFWMALGWDVNHEHQTNPYEQEVKVERNEKLAGRRGRADYAFFTAPNFRDVRFFVEAKKPARDLDNADDYFQTIRYGWSSRTPLAVLMDFEQVRIVDCRYKPNLNTALDRGVLKFHYSEFADKDKFSEMYWLFAREAVLNNSLEKFTEALPSGKGKARQKALIATGGFQSIDESFLAELDGYREELARSFKNKNPDLDSRDLTEVTQRTLDRLVFMRFLEDKLIESEPLVSNFGDSGSTWRDFIAAARKLDRVYNGIIFKDHPVLDAPSFQADEKVFGDICEQLSHTNSPYDFNAIPIHILGSIYERFLGKTIVATAKRATVEEKPEVRKAGGVYYTPEYIVRYIVENTVGKMIAGKAPDEIKTMHFADIACGSGSFLLGVYDVLLRAYSAWYNKNKTNREKGIKAGCLLNDDETLRLSLRQKGEILLNNVYGVDIDAQAVEVAQLSLYLKLLEDETPSSKRTYQQSFREALLPSLNHNIVCGNSLIDWDILDGKLFDREGELKLNPMSYSSTFPNVMKAGGFDAIVGNPPYGLITDDEQKAYYTKKFLTPEGRFDIYELFIEQAISLCRKNGELGYIIPSPLLSNLYTRKLRKYLLEKTTILEITNFGIDVFADPTVHTCILMIRKNEQDKNQIKIRKQVLQIDELGQDYDYSIIQEFFAGNENQTFDIFIDPQSVNLISKMGSKGKALGDVCFIRQCIKTGNDPEFVKTAPVKPGVDWKKSLRGKSIARYTTIEEDVWLKYGDWLARNWKNQSFYETPKIAVRETGNRITATIDLENRYFLSSLYAVYPKAQDDITGINFYLGIINSTLATYFIKLIAFELTKGAFTKIRTNQLARLPIRTINFSDPTDKARHDKMVNLVTQMLSAKQQLASARSERDQSFYDHKCQHLEREIDRLVYELYDLTEEEIALVEGTA